MAKYPCIISTVKKKQESDSSYTPSRPPSGGDISDYLREEVSKLKIELLSDKNMADAIHEYVEKMESDSVSTYIHETSPSHF